MLGITDFLWRLVPANPILLRVVSTAGKRRRDLIIRSAYLGLLVLVVIFSLFSTSGVSVMDLSELAKTSSALFQNMSYWQLGLVALLAPVFTAGAITQEKDSQTYDILLSTPLTNGQVVLGSLLSRLFFVLALLISGIPIFSITQIFGGVAVGSITMSFLIAAATAFVTGALAMAIATFKIGTRRTIFSFYLFIAIYLMGGYLLDRLPWLHVVVDPKTGKLSSTSWLTAIHPFLALRVIFNDKNYMPPELGALPESLKTWPLGWYWSSPQTFYVSFMMFLSLVLVLPSIVLLRRVAQSTLSLKTWLLTKLRLSKGDRTRKPRAVWSNPIAWREAKTKASAARATFLRYGFMIAGIGGAIVMVICYGTVETPGKYIGRNGYDPVHHTIVVVEDGRPNTMPIARDAMVTRNGKATNLSELVGMTGKMQAEYTRSGRLVNTLTLHDIPRLLSADQARSLLLGACMVEFAVILLIVTNAAASTVTREKEDGTLDLLLSTPITSRYYIWGKLRGLVSFVLPLIAVPVISAAIFVVWDIFRWMAGTDPVFNWIVFPEAILILPGVFIIVSALAAILGMQMSLRSRKTVMAVMSSVGIMAGVCGTLGYCGTTIVSQSRDYPEFAAGFSSFSPFTVLTLLIDPYHFGGHAFDIGEPAETVRNVRWSILVFSWVATAAYAAIVWSMYKSMVKNFDMTIRKQSR